MNKVIQDSKLIEVFKEKTRGVFLISDLKNLLNPSSPTELSRRIKNLELNGIVSKMSRGVYVAGSASLEVMSQRIAPNSYISLGTVLADNLMVGSIPQKTLYAIKIGKNRSYQNDQFEIVHYGIAPHLFFGFTSKRGVRYAEKEKALLDTLYFYQKGKRFSFNIYEDIVVDSIDFKKIKKYLNKYKNPKFKKFVLGYLNDRN